MSYDYDRRRVASSLPDPTTPAGKALARFHLEVWRGKGVLERLAQTLERQFHGYKTTDEEKGAATLTRFLKKSEDVMKLGKSARDVFSGLDTSKNPKFARYVKDALDRSASAMRHIAENVAQLRSAHRHSVVALANEIIEQVDQLGTSFSQPISL